MHALQFIKKWVRNFFESVYEMSLMKEFELRDIKAKNQVCIPLFYKEHELDKKFRLDVLVEDEIIIEIKSSEILHPVYEAQIISYLKLAKRN